MIPSDINPAISDTDLPVIDFKRLTATKKIEPKGPRLNIQPVGAWLILDMPEELSPEMQGGIVVPEASRKKFEPFAIVPVVAAGPEAKMVAVGERVIVLRMQVEGLVIDGHHYYRIPEGAIVGKVA
jgi:co-chaperonin GroES (HSP10)